MWSWCKKCPEFPVARKCCFCIPVRRGVIIFGYVNLVVWLLMFPMLVYMLAEQATRDDGSTGGANGSPGGANASAGDARQWEAESAAGRLQLPLTTACVLLDAVMTVVLLVGAHQKRRLMLVVYVWGGASVQLMMLALDLVFFDSRHALLNAVFLVFLGLNVYLLYLVWSLTVRLRTREVVPSALLPHAPITVPRSREWRYIMHRDTASDAPATTAPAY